MLLEVPNLFITALEIAFLLHSNSRVIQSGAENNIAYSLSAMLFKGEHKRKAGASTPKLMIFIDF